MNERITCLRKTLGLTQKQFGEKIGVQRGTVANYELGRNIPTETVRLMICKVYGVRREWLETGEGEMFEKKSRYEQAWDMSEKYLKDENETFTGTCAAAGLLPAYDRLPRFRWFCGICHSSAV